MANKLKSSKTKPADPEQLKQEKEETVEVKQLLKDERTHKIAGSILLLFAFLFFIAFTSYLFTWGDDQDKFSYRMLLANDIKVQNLLGTFGAFISEVFVRHGFGIASYLICSTFFVIGVNLFFGKKVFSVVKNIKYLILGLPLISVAAAVVFQGKAFPYGGAAGDMMRDWLYQTIGKIGTIAVLSVAVLSYVIWRFNPVFKLPSKKEINADQDTEAEPENISEKVEDYEELGRV
ncbi:MAG TPA: DNA translocase FtsK 4TM domain-containing protein [Ferruginibacter sp.]|nr:DNA translocase FtsK 4TM domain-containing protein [Ferruginibacter sp.]